MAEPVPSARQIEYALALGVPNPHSLSRSTISEEIDKAVKRMNEPVNQGQLKLLKAFGIQAPASIKRSREMVDYLYDHIVARRWIFSVIRMEAGASWSNYRQAPVDESLVCQIAESLKKEKKLFAKIRDRQGANHNSGGDVWYKMTDKAIGSKEYQFVIDRLPESVIDRLESLAKRPASSGCLGMIVILIGLLFTLWRSS